MTTKAKNTRATIAKTLGLTFPRVYRFEVANETWGDVTHVLANTEYGHVFATSAEDAADRVSTLVRAAIDRSLTDELIEDGYTLTLTGINTPDAEGFFTFRNSSLEIRRVFGQSAKHLDLTTYDDSDDPEPDTNDDEDFDE